MTDKLITHEEVRINIEINYGILDNYYSDEQSKNSIKKEKQNMLNYITQNEQRDKDVARYFELKRNHSKWYKILEYRIDNSDLKELYYLEDKLSEVGKEE